MKTNSSGRKGRFSAFLKKYANFIFFAAVALITVIVLQRNVDYNEFVSILHESNLSFLAVVLLFMILYWLLEAYMLQSLIRHDYPEESFGHSFTLTMIGQYYNLITPGASGGQPLQLLEMTSRGISAGFGTAVLVQKYALYQLSVTLIGITGCLINYQMIASWHGLSKAMIVFGLMINILGSLAVVIVSLYPNFARIVARWCVKAGAKMRLVKDPEKTYKKADHFVAEYEVAISALKDRLRETAWLFAVNLFAVTIYFCITYWIYRALGLNEMNAFQIIAVQSVLYLVFTFIPLPGGSGGAEIGFTLIFGSIFGPAKTSVAMVIWRIITFYFVLCAGGIYVSLHSLFNPYMKRKKLSSTRKDTAPEPETSGGQFERNRQQHHHRDNR